MHFPPPIFLIFFSFSRFFRVQQRVREYFFELPSPFLSTFFFPSARFVSSRWLDREIVFSCHFFDSNGERIFICNTCRAVSLIHIPSRKVFIFEKRPILWNTFRVILIKRPNCLAIESLVLFIRFYISSWKCAYNIFISYQKYCYLRVFHNCKFYI